MSITSERITEKIKELGLSYDDVAKLCGMPKSTIYRYATGIRENIPIKKLKEIATALNTTAAYLMGWDEPVNLSTFDIGEEVGEVYSFPVLVSVRAGFGSAAVETYGDEIEEIPKSMMGGFSREECRVLLVKGDSMYPRICDGDKVLIHLQDSVDSGTVAVVVYNGEEATLKKVKYIPGEDWVELIPANPEYMTKRIEGNELEKCRVVGKVIRLIRDF